MIRATTLLYLNVNNREHLIGESPDIFFFTNPSLSYEKTRATIDLWMSKKFIIASLHSLPNDEWRTTDTMT